MHLTNEQLLELNEENREHLAQCEACCVRAKNLAAMRTKLQDLTEQKPTLDNWQQIKTSYQNQKHQQQIDLANKKVVFWKKISVAMAASLVLFLAGQNYVLNNNQQKSFNQALELAKAVESNDMVQNLLVSQLKNNSLNTMQVLSLQSELDNIDRKLQQAYLNKNSNEEKSTLWQQRRELIQSSIVADKKTEIMKI